jgi:hypothetical protein
MSSKGEAVLTPLILFAVDISSNILQSETYLAKNSTSFSALTFKFALCIFLSEKLAILDFSVSLKTSSRSSGRH